MKTDVEKLEETRAKLTVQVPYEDLKPEIDKVYKQVGKQVSIPGFRPGHVPTRIIDQRIGRGYVLEQAINERLGDYYGRALGEADLTPLGQPEVEVVETPAVEGKPGGDLKFTAEVDIVPDFDLPSLEGLSLEVSKLEVSDEDVEKELDQLRDRFASLKTVDRPAQDGDFTSIDMVAKIGDEEIDSVSGVSYQIGSASMLEGMDEALNGMKAEETTEFKSTLKGGDHEGEEADVTLTLHKVKERELPEADDDFAQMASEFDTIGELRSDLRVNVEKMRRQQQALEAREKLQDYLVDNTDFPLPQAFIDSEVDRLADGKEEADRDELAETVKKQAKQQIIVDRIANERDVEIDPNELYQSIFEIAQMYGVDPMQLIKDQSQVAAMGQDLRRNRALVSALREVTVKDEEGTEIDLSEFTKDPAEARAEQAAMAAAEQTAAPSEEEVSGSED
ncbi:trigger factor [Varibaculum timonense]|uniref:trigger factor n=1 Tax=Varibaculum timonense TaxID=1964383 RepID=UPI0022E7F9DF|nr:trigger factor [Varibaculum timonense]